MTYYKAKFTRAAKPRPADWLIVPDGLGGYRLEQIGGFKNENQKSV